MKIKRIVAKDMRTALNEVKATLGADAVIMSNTKTADGIEIVAAVDSAPKNTQPEPESSNNRKVNSVKQPLKTAQKYLFVQFSLGRHPPQLTQTAGDSFISWEALSDWR